MKTPSTIVILLFSTLIYSQDPIEIKRIDSIVAGINNSGIKPHYDTIKQNFSAAGLSTTICLAMVVDSGKLKRFENQVFATVTENGTSKKTTTSSIFYYNQNKLIKVHESISEEGKEDGQADWYYSDEKPIYYTLKNERAEERSILLVQISKAMIAKARSIGVITQ